MRKIIVSLTCLTVVAAANAVPNPYPGSCTGLRAVGDSRYVYSDRTPRGESCEVVYVGPNHADAEIVSIDFDEKLPATCDEASQILEETNAAGAELLKVDLSTAEGAEQAKLLLEKQKNLLARYKQIMVGAGAKVKLRYDTLWKKDLERIRENNPEVKVLALPTKKVVLFTGLLSTALTKEAFLQTVPGRLGFELNGKKHFAWENQWAFPIELTPAADKLEFTEILGASSACPLLKGERFVATTLSAQADWNSMDENGHNIEQGLLIVLDNGKE